MLNPWLGMGMVLGVFGMLMAGLQAYRRSSPTDPEVLRKLLHLGMGLVTLSFPWVFTSAWPVALLAGLFAIGLAALRISQPMQRLFGGVIGGVHRDSLGEIYFPLAVGLVFFLSRGDPVNFCTPMLILTLADTGAALIGTQYGRRRFLSGRGWKSLEGSMAFLAISVLVTLVSLRLLTGTGRAESVLIALVLGLLLTLVEAAAGHGLDNLLIPLGGFLLLRSYRPLDAASLTVRLGVALLLVALVVTVGTPRPSPGRTRHSPPALVRGRWLGPRRELSHDPL
jgi:phytol kinase